MVKYPAFFARVPSSATIFLFFLVYLSLSYDVSFSFGRGIWLRKDSIGIEGVRDSQACRSSGPALARLDRIYLYRLRDGVATICMDGVSSI